MKWDPNMQSDNVEDRRNDTAGGGGLRRVGIGGGIGTLVLVVVALLFGVDPSAVLQIAQVAAPPAQQAPAQGPAPAQVSDAGARFVSYVLADTEKVWSAMFAQAGAQYPAPHLVLFSRRIGSACGLASAASGPFYCPADRKVYIDLAFYDELKQRFHAPGDFAQAYVIAHEVGHHVQTLLGTMGKVEQAKRGLSEAQANALSVRVELQADCYAGVWAHHADQARGIIEQGDVQEALNAASQIGDDNIQRMTQGQVVPDAFTHGSAAQRVRWFQRGLGSGSLKDCNTFGATAL